MGLYALLVDDRAIMALQIEKDVITLFALDHTRMLAGNGLVVQAYGDILAATDGRDVGKRKYLTRCRSGYHFEFGHCGHPSLIGSGRVAAPVPNLFPELYMLTP